VGKHELAQGYGERASLRITLFAKLAIRIPNLELSLGILPGSFAQFERLKLRQEQRSTTAKELLLHLAG
jgi:hypothetical protein